MIDLVFSFLQARLNQALPRDQHGEPQEKLFVYVGTDKDDSISFKPDALSMLLVRIEEETSLRPPDRYARAAADGARLRVEPEIRLNLWVLVVARFPDYLAAMRHLSRVIGYFQNHRVFQADSAPDLGAGLQQLTLDLVTPSFSEQNELWGTLRTAYLPSLLYKVRLVVFQDGEAQVLDLAQDVQQSVSQVPS